MLEKILAEGNNHPYLSGEEVLPEIEKNTKEFQEVENKKELINKKTIDKLKNDMNKFISELRRIPIPKQSNEENQYRILSFPWCISGNILSSIKYIKYDLNKN